MPENLPTLVATEWHQGFPYNRWSDGRLLPVVRGGDGSGGGGDAGDDGDAGGEGGDGGSDAGGEEDLGEKGKKALAAERDARSQAERARKAAEKEASDLKARLAKFEEATKSEQEKLLEAARKEAADATRSELTAELHQERVVAAIIRAASGKFVDPQDAVDKLAAKIEVGDDGRPDEKAVASAIEQLLKDKPHLAVVTQKGHGSADQGTRKNGQQKPATLSDAVAARYAGT